MSASTFGQLSVGYLGLEVADRAAFGTYLADVVGLLPGEPTTTATTWRNDDAAQRLIISEGPTNDAAFVGFEAIDAAAFDATAARLAAAGFELTDGTPAEAAERRVVALKHTIAPWGIRAELVHGLAAATTPFRSALVPGGFHTEGVGFGHVVFATTHADETHRFLVDGLGMRQSDWIETELAPGIELQVRFYHCNGRHHSVAIARAPFELPTHLHHLMLEANEVDDVGTAYDRAFEAGLQIANGLGKHDNDRMFSFYAVTPAGFQVEIGTGARTVTDDWDENRRYTRISVWGHQPVARS